MSVKKLVPISDYDSQNITGVPGTPLYANIDDDQNYPNTPDLANYNTTVLNDSYEVHPLEPLTDAQIITQIDMYVFLSSDGFDVSDFLMSLWIDGETFLDWPISHYGPGQWFHMSFPDLNLTQDEFNQYSLFLYYQNPIGGPLNVYAAYVDVTYTPLPPAPTTDAPLAKRTKPMSGCNYFVKNYIKRKIEGKSCYRTPDGELF